MAARRCAIGYHRIHASVSGAATHSGRAQRLLEPGYHEVESGYCALPDGTAYVASRVAFPHCTGDMFAWWMWWHSVEPARYTLWYPYNHVYINPVDRAVLTQPELTQRWRTLGHITLSPSRIGDIAHAAVVLNNSWK